MDGPTEELEPLFDYSRVQPLSFVSLDEEDDSLDKYPSFVGEKRRRNRALKNKTSGIKHDVVNLDDDDRDGATVTGDAWGSEDNEDWLNPPPRIVDTKVGYESEQILKELRLKKQELIFVAQSAETALKDITEIVKERQCCEGNLVSNTNSSKENKLKQSEPERQKIIISIQDKEVSKNFRIYKDDKLQKLFKTYAEKAMVEMATLVFCFDGDKIEGGCTANDLGLEDHDMIEVHKKAN